MTEVESPQDRLAAANSNPLIPHLYVNGFNAASGAVDITMALERNDAPLATLNIGYGCAKSMAQMLLAIVDNFEKSTESRAVTHAEFHQAMAAQQRVAN